MADLIGPFDSADWAQTEWYNFAPTWAPSGIIGTPAASIGVGDFAVTASGLTLTVACNGDRAWIDGSGYKPDTDKTLTVTPNGNASLSRRDRLVIRRDLAAQTITVERLPGTPASTPAAPTLTQVTGGVYETRICSFLVPPNNGTALTGFVDERVWVDAGGSAGSQILANQGVASGTAPTSDRTMIVQAFSRVVATNTNGDATISFPSTFPNGLASVVVTSGDLVAGNHAYAAVISSATNSINTRHFQPGGTACVSVNVRANVVAVGW